MQGLIKPAKVAELLGVARSTIYKMVDKGLLRCVYWKVEDNGKEQDRPIIRFRMQDIEDFIKQNLTGVKEVK